MQKILFLKKMALFFAACLAFGGTKAADSLYVRHLTDTLASEAFWGRGYVKNGMKNAANFIASEMQSIGLAVQKQSFRYPVNTFPSAVMLALNGKMLRPGIDFLVTPASKSIHAEGSLAQIDSATWGNISENITIKLVPKLTWSVATKQQLFTTFQVLPAAINAPLTQYKARVTAKLQQSFGCQNIMGILRGTSMPDSLVVFTAHYDHLGGMGTAAWFAGANDNAGGVAMMLALAKQFTAHPPPYSVAFIAFAGEEAGLLGSAYFVAHPLIDLKKIRFLVNLDLVGNGDEGITVVNATEYPHEFELLQQLNQQNQALPAVNSRGKAANSDHYWFTENGVPSFFIYTMGKRKAYHDVEDVADTLPWWKVNELEMLLLDFSKKLMQGY